MQSLKKMAEVTLGEKARTLPVYYAMTVAPCAVRLRFIDREQVDDRAGTRARLLRGAIRQTAGC